LNGVLLRKPKIQGAPEKHLESTSSGSDRRTSYSRRTVSGPVMAAPKAVAQPDTHSFPPNSRKEILNTGQGPLESRSAPAPPQELSPPKGPDPPNAHAASSRTRISTGAESVMGDNGEAPTGKSLPRAAGLDNCRAEADEASGSTSKKSSARFSIKQERNSIVFSSTVRRFIFTSVSPQERLRLSNIINRLGGIADTGELNDDCTHLICGKLIRGAKLMGCIASGRWVVGADYVDQSLAAGKWLPEADFELGEPSRLSFTNLSEREQQLAQSCRRWRVKLESTSSSTRPGAFDGWRCVLYCSEEKANGLCPMLKAGGAVVAIRHGVEGAPLVFRPTHAIVCASEMWSIEELERLVSIGAKVFHLEYISRYLLEEHVDETSCYHVDYKKFLLTRKR
ncbi:hypothetical protein GCK32_012170, partial [Trichostrongylus colubriformis]